ncbi:MAG TPA: hypothetical protein VFF98_02570 [Novosphingobium sp.]|nr:hypothetical protein [Novosphingobium sp.]
MAAQEQTETALVAPLIEEAPAPTPEAPALVAEPESPADLPELEAPQWPVRLAQGLALAALLGWTGLALATHLAALADAAQWAAFVGLWAPPALLLVLLVLAVGRLGGGAGPRLLVATRALDAEAARLEQRLSAMNRELSLAREFLASQSRELETLGRLAVERVNEHGARLAGYVEGSATHVQVLGTVSEAAAHNMERVRQHLPVLTQAARDVANQIGNAGRLAENHVQELVNGFTKLNAFGQAGQSHVQAFQEQTEATLAGLDARVAQLASQLEGRIAAMRGLMADAHGAIAAREEAAGAVLGERIAALQAEIAAARATLDGEEAQSLTSLRARLSALRDESQTIGRALRDQEHTALGQWRAEAGEMAADIARRQRAHLADAETLAATLDTTRQRLTDIEARLTAIGASDAALDSRLVARLGQVDSRLADTEAALARLGEAGAALVARIEAGAEASQTALPAALAQAAEDLAAYERRVFTLRDAMRDAGERGAALSQSVQASREVLMSAAGGLSGLHDGLAARVQEHAASLGLLRQSLAGLDSEAARIAATSGEALEGALGRLSGGVLDAVAQIELRGARAVNELAERLRSESAAAIDSATEDRARAISAGIAEAARHAATLGSETAERLRGQLAAVEDLLGHLEQRLTEAREAAEEKVDNDFSRRAALITETLNSAAIDIAKALDADIADTAWAAYLRGDRGIFTRRAVRLLDTAEARAVLLSYERDRAFAEHVNRFIHDFEGMLRQLLSTRDGHALSVTLLSSDMGKLYVALAQAIERLRS